MLREVLLGILLNRRWVSGSVEGQMLWDVDSAEWHAEAQRRGEVACENGTRIFRYAQIR